MSIQDSLKALRIRLAKLFKHNKLSEKNYMTLMNELDMFEDKANMLIKMEEKDAS